MIKITLTLLFSLLSIYFFPSDLVRVPDTRSMGMGGTAVTQSFLFNPALTGLSNVKSIDVDIYNRFGVSELNTLKATFYYPNLFLPCGAAISSFGNDSYRENLFSVTFGKQVSKTITTGIGIHYRLLQSELIEYTPMQLSVDAGIVINPVDKLFIGFSILNFPSVNLSVRDEQPKLTAVYNLRSGISWELFPLCILSIETISCEEKTLAINMGVEYTPFSSCSIRAGLQGDSFMPTCGIGYAFSRFRIELATQYHSLLGVSTGLGIHTRF